MKPRKSHCAIHGSVAARRLMLGGSALAFLITPAQAQSDAGGGTETVFVTGSRISQPGFTAPTPVMAVSGATMDKVATTIGDALAT